MTIDLKINLIEKTDQTKKRKTEMSERAPVTTHETMTRFTSGMEKAAALRQKYAAERAPITTHGRPEKEARERLEWREATETLIDGKGVEVATLIDKAVDERGTDVFVSHDESGNEITGIVRVERVSAYVGNSSEKEAVSITYERPSARTGKRQVTTFRFSGGGIFNVTHDGSGTSELDNGMPNPFEEAQASYEGGLGARKATPDYEAHGSSILDQEYKAIFDDSQLQQVSYVVAEAVSGIEGVLQKDSIESQQLAPAAI